MKQDTRFGKLLGLGLIFTALLFLGGEIGITDPAIGWQQVSAEVAQPAPLKGGPAQPNQAISIFPILFEDDFENNNFDAWTRFNDGSGFLYTCGQAAIHGSYGACVERGTNDKRKQLIDETPTNEITFNARFNFDINNLSMTTGERFRFMQFKMDALRPAFIVLKYDSGVYSIQLNTLLDDLTKVKTGWVVLPNAPTTIEVDWQQSSGESANDGFARLYLNDALQAELTGLDNFTLSITSFRMGFTSRLAGKSISGIFYIDDVATNTGLPPDLSLGESCVEGARQVVILNSGGSMPTQGTITVEYEDGTSTLSSFQLGSGQDLTMTLSNIHGWIVNVNAAYGETLLNTGPINNCLEVELSMYYYAADWIGSLCTTGEIIPFDDIEYEHACLGYSYDDMFYTLDPIPGINYSQTGFYTNVEFEGRLDKAPCDCPSSPLCCLAPSLIPYTVTMSIELIEDIEIDTPEGTPPSFGGILYTDYSILGMDIDADLGVLSIFEGMFTDWLKSYYENRFGDHKSLTIDIWTHSIDPLLTN